MKGQEKQIEVKKLVNIITKTYPNKYSIEYPAKAIRLANELLEHYQPKLPKDSVVLSMEELKDMVKARTKCVENAIIRTRKETAEKIYDYVERYIMDDAEVELMVKEWFKKQFGVEIKE